MDKEKLGVFDKLENFYLSAMRKALLVFSTILFVYAAVTFNKLSVWGTYIPQ